MFVRVLSYNCCGLRTGQSGGDKAKDNNYILSSKVLLPTDSFSYISEAWRTTSWLDHCFSVADGHAALEDMSIEYGSATADHLPFAFTINVKDLPATVKNSSTSHPDKLYWSTLSKEDLLTHYTNTHKYFNNAHLPIEAISCKDAICKIEEYSGALCSIPDDIVAALYEGGKS